MSIWDTIESGIKFGVGFLPGGGAIDSLINSVESATGGTIANKISGVFNADTSQNNTSSPSIAQTSEVFRNYPAASGAQAQAQPTLTGEVKKLYRKVKSKVKSRKIKSKKKSKR